MNSKIIIEDIERRYMQYSMSNSDTMLYYRTRDFVEFLKSYDVVNNIIEDVKQKTPFSESIMIDEKLGDRKLPDEIMRSVGNSRDVYVSFLLHYLEWTFKKIISILLDYATIRLGLVLTTKNILRKNGYVFFNMI